MPMVQSIAFTCEESISCNDASTNLFLLLRARQGHDMSAVVPKRSHACTCISRS